MTAGTWKRTDVKEERHFDVEGFPDIVDGWHPARYPLVVRPHKVVLHLSFGDLRYIHVSGPRVLRNGSESKKRTVGFMARSPRHRGGCDPLPQWLAELVSQEGLPWGEKPDV